MTLVTYLDASGTADLPVLSVGGFIADSDQWKAFDVAWVTALSEEGVHEFHMREFAHSVGEYEAWKNDEPRRRRLITRLSEILNTHTRASLFVGLPIDAYKKVDAAFQMRERLGSPYAQTMSAAILFSLGWRDDHMPKVPIEFFIEKGDVDQADLFRLLPQIGVRDPVKVLSKRCAKDGQSRCVLPFQGADYLAYESMKALRMMLDEGRPGERGVDITARASLMRLAAPWSHPTEFRTNDMWRWIDEEGLTRGCLRLRVPRRVAGSGPPASG
jgi:hypothetical protein